MRNHRYYVSHPETRVIKLINKFIAPSMKQYIELKRSEGGTLRILFDGEQLIETYDTYNIYYKYLVNGHQFNPKSSPLLESTDLYWKLIEYINTPYKQVLNNKKYRKLALLDRRTSKRQLRRWLESGEYLIEVALNKTGLEKFYLLRYNAENIDPTKI